MKFALRERLDVISEIESCARFFGDVVLEVFGVVRAAQTPFYSTRILG